jgi:hypothetical protein
MVLPGAAAIVTAGVTAAVTVTTIALDATAVALAHVAVLVIIT